MWFVSIREGTSGCFIVCMGDEVKNRFVVCCVVHENTNGQWELRGLIRHDELGDIGCLVPINKEVY